MDCWIVVVDDEALSLTNVKNMLDAENMRTSCLRSGKDLLKFIEKNSPDLILLDIVMPEMDGFETLEALREYEDKLGKHHIPVIFLTGENDILTEQKGLRLGASDYIRKPFDKDILLSRIEKTVDNSKTIENLTEEAATDRLTGFLNKNRGTDRVTKLCLRKTGALMFMDIDSFKLVNDLFGHDMGDKMLVAFSDIIRKNTRETDTISRIGGDEFLAFYEDLTDVNAVESLTMRLNLQLQEEAERILGKDHGIPLGISIGVAFVPAHGRDFDALLAKADSALYEVKKHGKHGFHICLQGADADDVKEDDPAQKLERIIKIVEERNEKGGALLLGTDSFALIYRFVMRFYKRYGGTAALVLFTLSNADVVNKRDITEACGRFSIMLQNTLRLSDIIMQAGPNSYFIMLTERTRSEAEGAIKRILSAWDETDHEKCIQIRHAFKYIDNSGEE